MSKNLDLSNKRILVTGAAGFLGLFICDALMAEGADVIGVDVQSKPPSNGAYPVYKLDITDKESMSDFKFSGSLDGIVNNAATSFRGNENTSEEFMKTLEVNIEGTYNCITQFKNTLSRDASIVNIASIYGILSPDFRIYSGNESLYSPSVYGASKAAIVQMTRYYATQLAPIRVNSVSPGGILQGHNDSFIKQYSDRVPMKRMANPEEITDAILFLLSPMSSYITGHNLVVDGGMSAW